AGVGIAAVAGLTEKLVGARRVRGDAAAVQREDPEVEAALRIMIAAAVAVAGAAIVAGGFCLVRRRAAAVLDEEAEAGAGEIAPAFAPFRVRREGAGESLLGAAPLFRHQSKVVAAGGVAAVARLEVELRGPFVVLRHASADSELERLRSAGRSAVLDAAALEE